MFGRSKSKTENASAAGEPAVGSAASGAKAPQDQASRQRAGVAIRHSLAFAQIVSVLMRSQQHNRYPIGALRWLVLPPLLTGQFSIAHSRPRQDGLAVPVAVALWARVSPEVDKKLTETLDKPVQLRPNEWRCGDILWLMEAIGNQRALPQFLKQLSETVFKGREVKVRCRGADGKVSVKTLQELAAA